MPKSARPTIEQVAASDQNTIRAVPVRLCRSPPSNAQCAAIASLVAASSISSRASGSADVQLSRIESGGPSARRTSP
jgi:hypothetical protein